jgi:DNA-binding beta-propeller fold protein YncE
MTKRFALSVFAALLSGTASRAADNILVASIASHTIEEFSASGAWVKTFATTGGYAPVAIAQSPLTGEYFVTAEIPSGDSNRILRYHTDGTFDTNWDTFAVTCENCGGGDTESLLFDNEGNLYVATHYGGAAGYAVNIYKYLAADLAQANPPQWPAVIATGMIRGDQLAFRSSSEICIAGFIDEDVKCFNIYSGVQTADYYTEIHASKVSPIIEPAGLAFDSAGRMYLTSVFGGQIAKELAPGGPIVQLAQIASAPVELNGNLVLMNNTLYTTTYSTSPATPGTPDSLVAISTTTGAVTRLISGAAAPNLGNAHLWGASNILFIASQPLTHPIQ